MKENNLQTLNQVKTFLRSNSPALLSGAAVFGTLATAGLSYRAGYKIGYDEAVNNVNLDDNEPAVDKTKRIVKRHWVLLSQPATSTTLTITAIVLSNRVSAGRTAAATAAYALAETTLSEYREKVVEKFGEKADGEIKADIQQDRVERDQPRPDAIVITNGGSQLCKEAYTGRYFLTDMETLRRAQNDLNAMLIMQDCVTLSEWYHMIGLSGTTHDHDLGWNSDKLMELEFSAVITEDGRPCMVFEYNYVRPLFG